MDVAIRFPAQGHIHLENRALLAEPGERNWHQFVMCVFQTPEITQVTIRGAVGLSEVPRAELSLCPRTYALQQVDILVQVEKSGNETASAKIRQILNNTAAYKLTSQHKGEPLADNAVIPTLAVGAVGMAAMGLAETVAVLNSDFCTGIRVAAPLPGNALVAGSLRQQGYSRQTRTGARADERGRHYLIGQDRYADSRAAPTRRLAESPGIDRNFSGPTGRQGRPCDYPWNASPYRRSLRSKPKNTIS